MDWKFTNEFTDDLEIYDYDKEFMQQLYGKIKEIEKADSIKSISGIEHLRERKIFYRFKITAGKITYRICIKLLHNKIWFALIDSDKKRFYKRA